MVIVYLVSTLAKTGPINQLYDVVSAAVNNADRVVIVTLSKEPLQSKAEDFIKLGVEIKNLNLSRIAGLILAQHKIYNIMKKIKPDVIHAQGIRSQGILASLSTSAIKVSTVHNCPQLDYASTYGFLFGYILTLLQKKFLLKINNLVSVSNTVKDNLSEEIYIRHSTVIANGIDTHKFAPLNKDSKILMRKMLNLPETGYIWIVSGNVSQLKGSDFIARKFDCLIKTGVLSSEHYLVFIGDGPLLEPLKNKFRDNKNIVFFGSVNSVSKYLTASDFYISASSTEGLPMSVIEAMSSGLPVLLSEIPAHQEIASTSSINIRLFNKNNNSFDGMIVNLIGSNYESESKEARKTIVDNFNVDTMKSQYLHFYKSKANNVH